jgi:acyl-CoA thioesterase FadM
VVAVQRETQAIYRAPLRWQEGATIEVATTDADDRGFTQQFTVTSTATGAAVATFLHKWVWLDVNSGRRVDLPTDVQQHFLAS